MRRREFLETSAAVLAWTAGGGALLRALRPGAALAETFEIAKTEAEWRAALSPEQYSILREQGTESPGSSPLNEEKREGMFHCAGCDLPVYSSRTKYESGTGWPSFWESEPGAVGTETDTSYFMVRIECHCSRCGGHFGHIFDDGPPPTGKRHCINGLSLNFKPAAA